MTSIAPTDKNGARFHVTFPHFNADGNPLLDPPPHFVSTPNVTVINLNFDGPPHERALTEFVRNLLTVGQHRFRVLGFHGDGEQHHVSGGQSRRKHQTVIVGMRHDQPPHQASRDAPTGCPGVSPLTLLVNEHDVLGLGECLTQEVAGSGLQCFSILHHRFDADGVHRAGESLSRTFVSRHHRHRHHVFREAGVHLEHFHGFFAGFFFARVHRMTFLPEELSRSQEKSSPQFPTHHVCPLVDQQRQIAIALDPLAEHGTNDGFTGRTNDQRFIQLSRRLQSTLAVIFQTVMGDHCTFFGKAVHVLRFLFEEALGNEQWEIRIAVTGFFEPSIQITLDVLPDGVPPRLDDHAPSDRRGLGQISGLDDLLVPLGVVLTADGFNRRFGLAHGTLHCRLLWPEEQDTIKNAPQMGGVLV